MEHREYRRWRGNCAAQLWPNELRTKLEAARRLIRPVLVSFLNCPILIDNAGRIDRATALRIEQMCDAALQSTISETRGYCTVGEARRAGILVGTGLEDAKQIWYRGFRAKLDGIHDGELRIYWTFC